MTMSNARIWTKGVPLEEGYYLVYDQRLSNVPVQ